MKIPGIASLLLLTGFFLPVTPIVAQSAADDSMLYKKAVYHVIGLYHQAIGEQSGLYNGSQYGKYPFPLQVVDTLFGKDGCRVLDAFVYDGILYEQVELQYDEVQEVLIMQDSTRRIQLLNQKLQGLHCLIILLSVS